MGCSKTSVIGSGAENTSKPPTAVFPDLTLRSILQPKLCNHESNSRKPMLYSAGLAYFSNKMGIQGGPCFGAWSSISSLEHITFLNKTFDLDQALNPSSGVSAFDSVEDYN